jgi:hypothetical protein
VVLTEHLEHYQEYLPSAYNGQISLLIGSKDINGFPSELLKNSHVMLINRLDDIETAEYIAGRIPKRKLKKSKKAFLLFDIIFFPRLIWRTMEPKQSPVLVSPADLLNLSHSLHLLLLAAAPTTPILVHDDHSELRKRMHEEAPATPLYIVNARKP